MNVTASSTRLLRPAAVALGLLAAAIVLPSTALAQRNRDGDRDRGHDRDRSRSDTHYSVGVGVSSRGGAGWHVGVSRDYHSHDGYYRPAYRPVYRPGYYVRSLPRSYRRVYYGTSLYFVSDGIYYQPYDTGYVVVERPIIINQTSSNVRYAVTDDGVDPNQEIGVEKPSEQASAGKSKNGISVWLGEQELRLIDGEFFKPTAQGLVWVPTPVGAVSDVLPIGSQVVWHEDIEYFRFDGVVFRKSPDGYKVVAAPWKTKSE